MSMIAGKTVVSVSGLCKSFGPVKAVDGIDFNVPEGSVCALLGPNGAGKSTTVRILEGLLRRDRGEARILDLDPWSEHDALKLRIGVMPQEFDFYEHLTPREALEFYDRLFSSSADADKLLKLVMLDDSVDVRFEDLSGGQKQKLGLALAMVNAPELLFLDEPTTGLDPSARRAIWSIIRSFRSEGKTIVLTTHYLEEAEQLADFVFIINAGRLVASGSPDDIIRKFGGGRKLVIRNRGKLADYLRHRNVQLAEVNGTVEVRLDGNTDLPGLVSLIEDSGIGYTSLYVGYDSLEDVFVRLVGKMSEGELR